MEKMTENSIDIRDLTIRFDGRTVLDAVSFSVSPRTFLAILGPNGAGKSTLLKVLVGLIRPTEGDVRIFGESPETGRRYIGYVPQYVQFDATFPIMVSDVVAMGRYKGMLRRYTEEDRQAVREALDLTGIAHLRERQIGALSGGERQRMLLARALVRDPKILLLDEPTASIDPEGEKAFYALLEKLRRTMTIVMVTHDIGIVSDKVETMACLNKKLFYHGDAAAGADTLHEIYGAPVKVIRHGGEHIE